MIVRVIKTAVFGAVTFYATKKANTHVKLLATRAAAKTEMDRLQQQMKDAFESDASDEVRGRLFDLYFDQFNRVLNIYKKTF